MSTTVKTGWLQDNNGDKFAPKTLTSQVQTSDGILLEEKIQEDINAAKEEMLQNVLIDVDDAISATSENPVQNKVIKQQFDEVAVLLDEKADKSTTLAEYGINDAYTKTETKQAITDEISTFVSAYITSDGGAIDKLQEIANWIDGDKNGAADIIADVEANADAIAELETVVDGKSDSSHTHDDRYYTESEIDTKLSGKSDTNHNHDSSYDAKGAANEALSSAKEYAQTKFDEAKVYADDKSDFYVTMTPNENDPYMYSTDKTCEEVVAAYVSGRSVYAKSLLDGAWIIVPLTIVTDGTAMFITFSGDTALAFIMYAGGENIAGLEWVDIAETIGFSEHLSNCDNPHLVNATQVGAPTIAEMNTAIDELSIGFEDVIRGMVGDDVPADGSVPTIRQIAHDEATTALDSAKTYTDTKTSDLASTSSVTTQINTHNTSTSAHNDIRALIDELTTKLTNFLDVDDTTTDQLSEVIALINNNKGTLESITTSKINVSDIVNNLITNSESKVLSAAQGVAIKALIDALQSELDSHAHTIADVSELQSALDGKADASHGTHVNYPTTAPVMDGTASVGTATTVARSDHRHPTDTSRASQTDLDTHKINSDIHFTATERTKLSGIESGAQKNTITGVKGASESSYRTGDVNITPANIGLGNVNNTSDANKPVSTAQQTAINTALDSAKAYTDEIAEGKVPTSRTVNGKALSANISLSASDVGAAATSHTHSEYANQNAFSNVKVGNTTIAAESTTDTLTLVAGSNVTITPDATSDKITIAATDTVYTHPSSHAASMITGLATVATSGKYSDLSGLPTIPTVNNGTLTIKQKGTTVGTFTANQAGNTTIELTDTDTTYTLPAAGSSLGGVKTGGDVTISNGIITVNDDSHNHTIANVDGLQTALDGKLGKTTYEYNTELALGSSGKVCIGKFPMYDSNVSVEIKSTTSTTYNGTLVIATQNINTTGGGTYTATVYGDASNSLTSSIKIHYGSGSNVFSVYIDLPSWSKNLLHIQCVALKDTPTDVATTVDAIPSNATIIPTNALKAQLDTKQASITGGASTITSSNLTASRVLVSNSSGKVAVSDVTSTELGYLDGVTSNIQTQLNAKVPITRTINGKALSENITLSASDVSAYTKSEIDDMQLITVNDIDNICGTTIQVATTSEVTF